MPSSPLHLRIAPTFDAWRDAARSLLAKDVAPQDVVWSDERTESLLPASLIEPTPQQADLRVPKEFVAVARTVSHHRDEAKWSLLYRLLFRLTHGEPHLLDDATDDDVIALRTMERSIRRDVHKMHAFVRFRSITDELGEHFVAYHEPEHFIVRLAAPFFRERFGPMRWTIFTPDESANWDRETLSFGGGVARDAAPKEDATEDLWLTYYRNIFNPARVKVNAMLKEMPRKYWSTMPETSLIPELLVKAKPRVKTMIEKTAKQAIEQGDPRAVATKLHVIDNIPDLASEAKSCRLCDWANACTQTVFGEGPPDAKIMFVGEQPGDSEDLAGRPFVGPAGQLFARVLEQVGIDRNRVYVTNAVKHFKFEMRGKRRIHQTPNARDASNCRPWLLRELEIVKPSVLVCLGATAARSLLGNGFRITQSRGDVARTEYAEHTLATWHPSALLRVPDESQRERMEADFTADLARAAALAR
jgi:DNA polymerase